MCRGGNGWMWNGGYGGGWGWEWGWIVTAVVLTLLFAVVITAIVVAVRYLTGGGRHSDGGGSTRTAAEDVLAQRFARGEIDDTDYRQRMTSLREHR
jgi:putative membrane protein